MTTQYKFLPWYRSDAATLIRGPERTGPNAPGHFQTDIELTVESQPVTVPLHLYGPGDAAGLEPGRIRRRVPAHQAVAFEPHHFPALELKDPDLPWRLTPTGSASNDRLRPWLTLIALEAGPQTAVRQAGNAPLPVVAAPRDQLPDLTEAALWAHVQVNGPFPAEVADSSDPAVIAAWLKQHPDRAVARLLCPRRLAPQRAYRVCLVPTFEAGRLAGLGQAFDESAIGLSPAWETGGSDPVLLPVYDHWTFTTGPAVDSSFRFETLTRALAPHRIPMEAARTTFDPDPALGGEPLALEGALQPLDMPPSPAPAPEVRDRLAAWVNRPAEIRDGGGDPQLAPPLYARRQAGRERAGDGSAPTWFDQLNLDPRLRVVAALGAGLVRRHQETFLAEAWRQAGQIDRANGLLRGGQTARTLNARLKARHLDPLPPDRLLQVTGPIRARTLAQDTTLARTVQSSGLPAAGLEGAFRRLGRERGPHLRPWLMGQPDHDGARLFAQGFYTVPLTGWQAHHQTPPLPGRGWFHEGDEIVQRGDIFAGSFDRNVIEKPGTMYLAGDPDWYDYRFYVNIRSLDDDAVGFVFRYLDENNFYRFSWDAQRAYQRLVKCVNGQYTLLFDRQIAYLKNADYSYRLLVEGDRIQIRMGTSTLLDLQDSSLKRGRVGLYTWGISEARFSNFRLDRQTGISHGQLPGLITDEGTFGGPSRWKVEDGRIHQTSNIQPASLARELLDKKGTYLRFGDSTWRDYHLRVNFTPDDDDDAGVMFRYRNSRNYYRLSVGAVNRYVRLVKCQDGVFTLLWQSDQGFVVGETCEMEITLDGTRIRGEVSGSALEYRRVKFDLRDDAHPYGRAALYCCAMSPVTFHYLQARSLRHEGVVARLNASQLGVEVPPGERLDLPAVGQAVLAGVDPEAMVGGRVLDRLSLAGSAPADPLQPRRQAPELAQPLGNRLIEAAPGLLLPGLEGVPDDAVVMLQTNPAFVAALLAGANHEFGRELLWRGFPADAAATFFRQFWDVRGGAHGSSGPASGEAHKDIPPLDQWNPAGDLAAQVGSRGRARTVFLIRSDLIRSFPDARFYLQQGVAVAGGRRPGSVIEPHQFQGRLGDDTAFFGFDLDPDQVRGEDGGAGWYFVIEQRPLGERFGLVLAGPQVPPDWTDLGWNHMIDQGSYLSAASLTLPPDQHPAGADWGRNAGHMAAITRRRPFRIMLHAARLAAPTATASV